MKLLSETEKMNLQPNPLSGKSFQQKNRLINTEWIECDGFVRSIQPKDGRTEGVKNIAAAFRDSAPAIAGLRPTG